MNDDDVRDWLARRRWIATPIGERENTLTAPPVPLTCEACGEAMGLRFGFSIIGTVVIADREWQPGPDGRYTRSWKRADEGRPARHAGYTERHGDTESFYMPEAIRQMDPGAVMVCRCGESVQVPLDTRPDIG